jgi:dipeptidase D
LFNTFKHLKAEVYKDKFNNVVARIPATFGLEKLPMLTLQAHSDMVAVKTTNSKHNFNKDPIQLIFQKDKVTAKNTSLGADNGIGIALILALFNDPNIKHGPLEAIVTSKEEIGLIGAKQLNPKLVKGKYLINLDSETDSKIIVGCVGSSTINSYVSLKWIKPKFKNSFNLTIANLLGGHSGVDIDKNHLNAIKGLFYVIKEIQRIHPILINDISGGDVLNTIPSSSNIVFNTNASFSEIQKIIRNACLKLLQTHPLEKHLKFTLNKTKTNKCVNERQTILIINFFNQVFNGVKIFNKKYQLPQASSNLGKTYIKNNQLYIGVNIRDINKESKLQTNQLILDKLKTLNAKYKIHGGPG